MPTRDRRGLEPEIRGRVSLLVSAAVLISAALLNTAAGALAIGTSFERSTILDAAPPGPPRDSGCTDRPSYSAPDRHADTMVRPVRPVRHSARAGQLKQLRFQRFRRRGWKRWRWPAAAGRAATGRACTGSPARTATGPTPVHRRGGACRSTPLVSGSARVWGVHPHELRHLG